MSYFFFAKFNCIPTQRISGFYFFVLALWHLFKKTTFAKSTKLNAVVTFFMKKFFLICTLALGFLSCEENIVFNDPAFQANNDGKFWRAIDATATLDGDGGITITAVTSFEEVVLRIPSTNEGTYNLGNSNTSFASYKYEADGLNLFYITGNNVGGNGQIILEENNIATDGTITGKFRFNAISADNNPVGGEVKNFNQGKFYRVRVVGLN